MKPIRVQRKRTKGWRMPPDTIYVGRGSKWGNPFKVGDLDADECVLLFRQAMICFPKDLSELRGKNMACWCREDAEHCHADVLLELANQ